MKKSRYLAILAASVLAVAQITTAVFAASEINGSVHVNGDDAWGGNSEAIKVLEGESGSVTNTEGGAAVTVTGSTKEQDGKESLSFTVEGNVSSDNSAVTPAESAPDDGGPDGEPSYEEHRYGDYPVTGVEVTVPEPDKEAGAVTDTKLEVTGDVSAKGTIDNGGHITGMSINALGGQSQDQSVTVIADGNVKASDGAFGNNVTGVEIVTSQENDDGEEAPEAPSDIHNMTTNVTAGSVTVEGGSESTATGLYINAGSDHAVHDVTVDVKDDINVSGREGQTVTGINLSQGGANDNFVNISVGGSVAVDGKGYSSDGVQIGHIMSANGETSAKIDIKENLTVKSDGGESFVKGVDRVESEMAGNLDIHVGGNVTAEAVSEATGLSAVKTTDNGTAEIKVDGDVTATATGTEGSAVAIFADINQYSGTGDVLVGKNATASGADSNGIMMNLDITPKDNEEGAAGSGSAGASNKEPVRIEVLGTVDGGADGNDLLIRVTDCNMERVYDDPDDPTMGFHEETGEPMAAEDVKTALTEALPEIVTHELKNGSIKAVMKSDNADNEKAALEALTEMTFYTVNYTTKVTDETGAEDDSLGTITITQYDGKELEKKELRYDGSTAYVAKAGDKILIDVKVKNGYVDKDREEKVTGTSEVKTEETDTEIITTTTTPVTRKTWTERTAYELDLDKLKIVDELGYDATVKLVKETSTAGGVTWSLEVTPVGSIDLDIEAIIKAITSEINLQEITENIVKVDKKAKEVKPEEEHKAAPDNNSKYHEAPKPAEENKEQSNNRMPKEPEEWTEEKIISMYGYDEEEKPEIGTQASAQDTGTNETQASKKTTIIDTVKYENLKADGKTEYTMYGKLMIVPDGAGEAKELLVNGKPVTAEKTFKPEKKNGTVEMKFTFDSSALAGMKTVVFEEVRNGKMVVAAHADPKDEGQQVSIVDFGTTATDQKTGTHESEASKDAVFIDVVKYQGLTPGKQYVLKGTLMDVDTGKELLINGRPVTSEKEFTPEKKDGSVEVEFHLDSSALAGKDTVVFEDLYRDGKKIAAHADIKDEGQKIRIIKIKTKAMTG